MANLKDIQRKIKSVSGTQKTTRAMKLVSTAKLRRAEELASRSRLFEKKTSEVISQIAARVQCQKSGSIDTRCFAEIDTPKMVDIVFVTADKGLCGGFNIQTLKAVKKLLAEYKEQNVKVRLRGIGKKGIAFFKHNDIELLDKVEGLSSKPDMKKAGEFITESIEDFLNETIDRVHIVYNGFKNVITQELHVEQVLPIQLSEVDCNDTKKSLLDFEAYDEEVMLESLVVKYVEFKMYYALIDSLAAEHSARMQAMDAATNNAKEMVKNLNVEFNKARQAAITTELIEIISGVESMK